jgi:hypothetical protein
MAEKKAARDSNQARKKKPAFAGVRKRSERKSSELKDYEPPARPLSKINARMAFLAALARLRGYCTPSSMSGGTPAR